MLIISLHTTEMRLNKLALSESILHPLPHARHSASPHHREGTIRIGPYSQATAPPDEVATSLALSQVIFSFPPWFSDLKFGDYWQRIPISRRTAGEFPGFFPLKFSLLSWWCTRERGRVPLVISFFLLTWGWKM